MIIALEARQQLVLKNNTQIKIEAQRIEERIKKAIDKGDHQIHYRFINPNSHINAFTQRFLKDMGFIVKRAPQEEQGFFNIIISW